VHFFAEQQGSACGENVCRVSRCAEGLWLSPLPRVSAYRA
jgi:hypothetical protein